MSKKIESQFKQAKKEIGADLYTKYYRQVFGLYTLDFTDTLVLNLPCPCFAHCVYCIDKDLLYHFTDVSTFLDSCKRTFEQFPKIERVCITGGSLKAEDLDTLVTMIREYYPNAFVTWNTNGCGIDESYRKAIESIDRVNLHRHSANDVKNEEQFFIEKSMLTLEDAKLLFGEKLFLRVTIQADFDLDSYIDLGIPLYLNRLLPGNDVTNRLFQETYKKMDIEDKVEYRRRNRYVETTYKGVPVRFCIGDKLSTHEPGRYPVYLNVVIVHRSGIVCGSWYEDDKVLYTPK